LCSATWRTKDAKASSIPSCQRDGKAPALGSNPTILAMRKKDFLHCR